MKITHKSWSGNVAELALGDAVEAALEPNVYAYDDVEERTAIIVKRQSAMLKVLIEALVEHQSADARVEFVKSLLGYGFKVEP